MTVLKPTAALTTETIMDVPLFGTVVAYPGGEAVFAKLTSTAEGPLAFDCRDCVYRVPCKGISYSALRPCTGGVYLDKMQYLQLKLVGDI